LSLTDDPAVFAGSLDSDPKGQRVGWLGNLQGYLPMEEGVLDVCQSALNSLSGMGCTVDEAQLGMPPEQIWQAWLVWRQALVGPRIAPFLINPANRAHIKAEALWEHDLSLKLTGAQLMAASASRTRFYLSMLALFEKFDVLAIPVASRLRRVNIPDFLPCPFRAYRPRGRGQVEISLPQLYWQAKHSS
jgi:amidase